MTHGLGVVLSIAGLVILVAKATLYGNAWHIVAASIFGSTLVLMYAASTLYHSIPLPGAKRILRVLDHSLIYFLIAGTYTPFTLGVLRGPWGWTLFGLIWALALAGILLKSVGGVRHPRLSTGVYLGMGWLVLVAARPLWQALPGWGLFWLAAGGVGYTAGVGFYAASRMRYAHFVWHLFVLAGTACHFIAVLRYAT